MWNQSDPMNYIYVVYLCYLIKVRVNCDVMFNSVVGQVIVIA